MAISANSVFEVRTAGSDTNGGGFVTGSSGTDYSQQNSKNTAGSNISTTDAVAAGTSTITSATAAFTSAITGNLIYLQGGTGSLAAGWYQATYVSSTSITVDRNVASGTGITMNIGGALLSPGLAAGIAVNGNLVYIQNVGADGASVYSITTASTGVAGGCILNSAGIILLQGYTTNRVLGNTDARPTIQANVASATLVSLSSHNAILGVIFDGNSQTSTKPCANAEFFRCLFKNFASAPSSGNANFYYCVATGNSAIVFIDCVAIGCEAYGNTATGFSHNNANSSFHDCLSYGNTGTSVHGFVGFGNGCLIRNCVAYGNGGDGFHTSGDDNYVNCYSEGNTGWGFNCGGNGTIAINCYTYNNGSGSSTFSGTHVGTPTNLTGTAVVNAGSNNFALNNTAGTGATLRAGGDPATFPRGTTANYRDVGAAQHQDPAGASIIVGDMVGGTDG